ncbi:MAG: ribosome biogenesis GTPase Der, partial [Gammaproteobacteria bacterium]|nr:ribosome biogenesis GTPase Der [Gammaproteobacteria bacterium]
PTSRLNEILERAIFNHQPPLVNGRRIKLRYAHLGGNNPPIIIVHGNQTEKVPEAYKRYLMHQFVDALKLKGTPLRMEFRTAENPFKGRKNKLTDRQVDSRKRMNSHAQKGKKKGKKKS